MRSSLLLLLLTIPAHANQPDSIALAKVKTAYLFNVAKFVEWPGDQSTVLLCVHPDSSLQPYLEKISGRSIGSDRMLKVITRLDMADGCHIYYTDTPLKMESVTEVLPVGAKLNTARAASETRVLSVSDHPASLERGYAMRFLIENGKLRFRFSKQALEKSSFQISSKLLVLASEEAS